MVGASVMKLLDTIIDTGTSIFERVIPDKTVATAAARDFEIEIRKMATADDSAWRQFVLDYTGKLTDIPKPIQYLRSLVRPMLTFLITGAYVWGWSKPGTFSPDQMDTLSPAMLLVLAFWFGEKALSRTGLVDILMKRKESQNA